MASKSPFVFFFTLLFPFLQNTKQTPSLSLSFRHCCCWRRTSRLPLSPFPFPPSSPTPTNHYPSPRNPLRIRFHFYPQFFFHFFTDAFFCSLPSTLVGTSSVLNIIQSLNFMVSVHGGFMFYL